MLRHLVFGIGLLSTTVLSSTAFAEGARTLQIFVSKDKQSMVVYDGEAVVATTKVSTGKAGHTTPSGIFSILEKRKYHESNIYSNAPMPFMQRLTWSGIALHEGVVPNYPASHGCIRIPGAFAKSLFGMTERGAHVIVTDAPVTPVLIADFNFFRPHKPTPNGTLFPDVELRTSSIKATSKPVEVAMNIAPDNPAALHPVVTPQVPENDGATIAANQAPLRILITRRGDREALMDAQVILEDLGFDTGGSDGYAGPLTRSAIAGFKRWKNLSEKGGLLTPEFLSTLYQAAGQPLPPAGQIMVRQDFKPLFEAPIGIKNPEVALGTHFFTVDKIERNEETAEWHGVTLPNGLTDATRQRLGITVDDDPFAPDAAAKVLDRIEIPHDVRERIETAMADGTSITINDQGIGPDTGDGTDFITITKPVSQIASANAQPESSIVKPRPVKVRAERHNGIGLY